VTCRRRSHAGGHHGSVTVTPGSRSPFWTPSVPRRHCRPRNEHRYPV